MKDQRNLVLVRCGDATLHLNWVSDAKNWDLAVSYFGRNDDLNFPEAIIVHRYIGGKWDGIYNFFERFPETLNEYDYVWLPDDDIMTDASTLDEMFHIVSKFGLEIAQPSLSKESYSSHLICNWNPFFDYRTVNFVEIMIPVIKTLVLKKVLPYMKDNKSGFGLDFVWCRFATNPLEHVAVIDGIQVKHTRPVGSSLKKMISAAGYPSSEDEQKKILDQFSNVVISEISYGGKLRNGPKVSNYLLGIGIAAAGWIVTSRGRHGFQNRISVLQFLAWVARNWIFALLSLRKFVNSVK